MTRRTKLADAPTQQVFILMLWRERIITIRECVTTRVESDGPW